MPEQTHLVKCCGKLRFCLSYCCEESKSTASCVGILRDLSTYMKKPALDPKKLEPRTSSAYPEPFRSRVLPREKRALGDALGLNQIGINLTTLPPGKESSMRHWHTHEDEFIFVLEGEIVLLTDEGEQVLTAGTCAGFPANTKNGHQLINKSNKLARYLEVSNRNAEDLALYPDEDLVCRKNKDGKYVFSKKDGTPY